MSKKKSEPVKQPIQSTNTEDIHDIAKDIKASMNRIQAFFVKLGWVKEDDQ